MAIILAFPTGFCMGSREHPCFRKIMHRTAFPYAARGYLAQPLRGSRGPLLLMIAYVTNVLSRLMP